MAHISKQWSNEEKANEILLKVLIPRVRKTRKNMQLHNGKEWLLILDIFGGQWPMKSKEINEENNGKILPVLNNMADITHTLISQ